MRRDVYFPFRVDEIEPYVSTTVLKTLDPEKHYGIYWFNRAGGGAAHVLYDQAHSADWGAPAQVPHGFSVFGADGTVRKPSPVPVIPKAQRTAEGDHPRLYRGLLSDVAATPLAPRANRCNPRVVKRKMSKFGVKGASHRCWPQPTKSFREAVVLLN